VVQACKSHDSARNSGRRVSNTWIIYPRLGDNSAKAGLIPDYIILSHDEIIKGGSQGLPIEEESAAYQLVGEVTAHQGI
jgi:hypothetical protein